MAGSVLLLGLMVFSALLVRQVIDSNERTRVLAAELAATQADKNSAADRLADQREAATRLEEKLNAMAELLERSASSLEAARQRMPASDAPAAEIPPEATPAPVLPPAVGTQPAPAFAPESDSLGLAAEVATFPEVLNRSGDTVATHAQFRGISGRRLVFRPASGPPVSLDIFEAHPDLLAHLDIDPAVVLQEDKERQARLAANRQATRERNRIEEAAEREAAARRAELLAAQRAAQFEHDLRLQKLETERLNAEAAMRAAEAALREAQKPPPVTYIYNRPWFPWRGPRETNSWPNSPTVPNAETVPNAPTTRTQPMAPAVPNANTLPNHPMAPAVPNANTVPNHPMERPRTPPT